MKGEKEKGKAAQGGLLELYLTRYCQHAKLE